MEEQKLDQSDWAQKILSLSLSCSTCSQIQQLSERWHQKSQDCMNHHEPSCSNLSWKKHASSPVSSTPPWYQPGFGMDLGPFMQQGIRKSIHRSFRERSCGCHSYHPSRRHRSSIITRVSLMGEGKVGELGCKTRNDFGHHSFETNRTWQVVDFQLQTFSLSSKALGAPNCA